MCRDGVPEFTTDGSKALLMLWFSLFCLKWLVFITLTKHLCVLINFNSVKVGLKFSLGLPYVLIDYEKVKVK